MSQEILPPSRGTLTATGTNMARIGARPMPPGTPVMSGHWWAFLDGDGDYRSMVNGQTLIYPRGVWFVVENIHFIALKNSSEPMMWLDGHEVVEKKIDIYGNISEQRGRLTP